MDLIRLRGIGVSPGIALGEAVLSTPVLFTARREAVPADRIPAELDRLRLAMARTAEELAVLRDEVRERAGGENAFIFDAHRLILEDAALRGGLERIVREEKVRSEWALSWTREKYEKIFEGLADESFRQRKSDVEDVLSKIYRNLGDRGRAKSRGREEVAARRVLVAHDLMPSEAALRLSRGQVLGIALDMGGPTSHTAILARSLDIPAVVGLHDVTRHLRTGDTIIVDGTDGEVIINPPPAVLKEFRSKRERYLGYRKILRKTAKLPSRTLDDVRFTPLANIELPEEVHMALYYGAEGIGLFRSEFIYLQRTTLPSEDDHYEIYARIVKAAQSAPVYIRTIDIGGDKALPQLNIEKEPNPALGLRAVRFSLKNQEMFRTQLRAVLRASVLGDVRVLVPMVTEVEEVTEVKRLFREVKAELDARRIKYGRQVPLGVMIEVPAAAAVADRLARDVDFLSIGTNDLIQYFLAVDRSNEHVSYLYKPLHPAVLRLIRSVITIAQRQGTPVTVCGEMAADPLSAIVLLGFGLRLFSMNPIFIPRIKKALRAVETRTVKRIVSAALELETAQEIEEYIVEKILVKHPEVFLGRRA
ncbi:MAG: phosphoenolpyruvate--protein phosphotransferase [Candidatus Aminicenantes bacterium]|nr:phosphoenolpyruvate--protein phosphotransferase [Candidatus Aminicenantes bacterium]